MNTHRSLALLAAVLLGAAKAKVTWGAASKDFSKEQLEAGVNLAAEFPATPFDAAFTKLVDALGRKQQFETAMIKSLVTNFRQFSNEAKADAELAKAFDTVKAKLQARQQVLDAEARKTLVPVKHTLTVTVL